MTTLGQKGSTLFGLFIKYEEHEVLWKISLESYSQHIIFFINYYWVQKARYKENELLEIQFLKSYSQHFILYVTYERAQ
jgi:hypothetical protein